jgi:glycosyltransferase involved in cell wall biosynthesis
MSLIRQKSTPSVSIGIFAWNEERAIKATIESLLQQSFFTRLRRRGWRCEVVCVANGCTDRTAALAAEIFAKRLDSAADCIEGRAENLVERGKVNAWNEFVHRLSAREAKFLFMMDADILIHRPDTLWLMLRALENDPEANIAVDRPCKDTEFKPRKTWRDAMSLAASRMTSAATGQLCGQLYCIRAEVARNIYLPKDLAACEDGFIKSVVCTDFLTRPAAAERIRIAAGAEHTFEAYTSLGAILKNQKRQIIGQTIVHVLVDQELPRLTIGERKQFAGTLRAREAADPGWLKRRLVEHLRQVHFFWRLYPGLLGQRFRRLSRLGWSKRVRYFPAAAAGWAAALISSFMAYRALKAGCTDYWPRAERTGFQPVISQNIAVGQLGAQGEQAH